MLRNAFGTSGREDRFAEEADDDPQSAHGGDTSEVLALTSRHTVFVHALFGIEMVGIALTIAFVVPLDPTLGTWRSPVLLFAVLTIVVGWILAWKRPRVPIGWLLLGFGAIGFLQGPATMVALALKTSHPLVAGWAAEFASESSWTWIPSLGVLLALVPLRFPTGELPSRRWAWFWWVSVTVLVLDSLVAATFERSMQFGIPNPTFVNWGASLGALELALELALVVVFVGAVVSLFVRYRSAAAVERAQLRWLFWAVAIVVGLFIVGGIENAIFGDESRGGVRALVAEIFDFANDLTFSLVPLAILVAVLRSGLYAIDRIISRTASYALVTVSVVAVYITVVLVSSLLLPKVQSLGIAAATLIAAALFFPLLRILRRTIDRRFNRVQYDAQKVVDAFGERIRTGVDPQRAIDDLSSAVQAALQPSSMGVWIKSRGLG